MEKISKGCGDYKSSDEKGAEVDFGSFFGILKGFEGEKAGEEVGKKEGDEGKPGAGEGQSYGKGEEPVAVADPFAFGNKVES